MRTLFWLVLAVGLGMGCLGRDVAPRSTTTLSVATLPTQSPPLALFVLRVADDALSADDRTHESIVALEQEAERASRPIVEMRYLLSATLVHAVDAGRFDAASTSAARLRLVEVAKTAAPVLRSTIERMHGVLDPEARDYLRLQVRARVRGWAHAWGPPSARGWVDSLGGPALDGAALEEDCVDTARAWADERIRVVATALATGPLEPVRRIDLVHQLRTGDAFE